MGCVFIAVVSLAVVVALSATVAYLGLKPPFRSRFAMLYDPAIAALDANYDLHCAVIAELIERHALSRSVRMRGVEAWERELAQAKAIKEIREAKAIAGGLRWMRQVKIAGCAMQPPAEPYYIEYFKIVADEIRKKKQQDYKLLASALSAGAQREVN